ncbi:type VI secretion system ATPase TssH [Azospirillum rugosum]|uniref:Type VI secretion system protein VasG n=1 Tax=Azospirillum rugosum TaxID=416170 RepID=A0ABS4SEC0_9PROT|nr:type VI secretion system ATPase TssH [Azospirillum rugosum]MBP2290287.1 type VI secretion system protein VasG [Azospirillum rugosum]MDQ0527763.1 type VI secretion system protein VasG [Azospirillum rugosum]
MTADIKSLIGKLDRDGRKVLERSAALCVSQTHYDVEVEHVLLALLRLKDGTVAGILRHYDVDAGRLETELNAALEKIRRGNSRTPAFSPRVPELLETALLISVTHLDSPQILLPAILWAAVACDSVRAVVTESAPSLLALPRERTASDLPELVRALKDSAPAAKATPEAAPASSASEGRAMLDQYSTDLTAQAKAGKIDPVIGRDREIRQVIDVMMRRRQNNPILVGDPGVGKTAIVEGLALRIAEGDVPPPLQGVVIRTLDLGLLQAGAGVKGEFENRLKSIIKEVSASPVPTVVFIDEAHALIGAGGAAGQGDAANLLKPALARGEFRTIAATTWAEYKKYFEKDPALARRFQPVSVPEPDETAAAAMLRGLVRRFEEHHGVRVLDDGIAAAVKLSARYIPARQLPDKAISVLDTACARVAIARSSKPEAIEALEREDTVLAREAERLEAETGNSHAVRLSQISECRGAIAVEKTALDERWRRERDLVEAVDAALKAGHQFEAAAATEKLKAIQGDGALVPHRVDGAVVAAVVSNWTGIPVGSMSKDDLEVVANLEDRMAARVVGQPQALQAIARSVRGYRAGLGEPNRPIGIFLLSGPSGVGKTETALALAELLNGGEDSLITINMSEYQEAHAVATLRGAPPGYVGYGSGGVLTEAVRRRPHSVILMDEVEKAHPDVLDMFYQVFDKGVLEDGEGVEVDFRNTLILLTSNLGDTELFELGRDTLDAGHIREACEEGLAAISDVLRRRFRPAFLGRLTVVPYYPLSEAQIRRIVTMKLGKLQRRTAGNRGAELAVTDAAVEALVQRALNSDAGARMIDTLLSEFVVPEVAIRILDRVAAGEPVGCITVDHDVSGRFAVTVA